MKPKSKYYIIKNAIYYGADFIDYKEMMHDAQRELEHEQERLSEKMDRVNGSCGHFEW